MGIWGNAEPIKDIDKYCKTVGLIFIGLGILHIILSGFLSAFWGIILIVLGIIALVYRAKSMIIVFGVALILVGLLNISSVIYDVSVFWLILGVLQIGWGIQELRRYKKTKENPKNIVRSEKVKGFVWYSLRISFWFMIIFWVFSTISGQSSEELSFSDLIWFVAIVFTFVVSIIHLTKHKHRAFAVVSLVLASYLILTMILGIFLALGGYMGLDFDYSVEEIEDMEIYCDNFCFEKGIEYEYYLVDYDVVKEKLICYCLDVNQEVLLDGDIPSSAYE